MKVRKGKSKVAVVLCCEDEKKFKLKKGESYLLNDGKKAELYICLPKAKEVEDEDIRKAGIHAHALAKQLKEKRIALKTSRRLSKERQISLFVEGAILSSFSFKKEDESPLKELLVEDAKPTKRAVILATSQNYARRLANLPPNEGTPEFFAKEAKALAKKSGLGVKVYDKTALRKMGANLALAVNSGSDRGVFLAHLSYAPRSKAKAKVALVGKGITFDSGGLGIKPAKGMLDMNLDKSGACAVFGAMKAIAELKPSIEVHGIAIFTENLPSGKAYKPSDIIKGLSGKLVEIQHTDAEGRLILADALAYAGKKVKPTYMIDVATLTGAMLVALGDKAIGLFSNDDGLAKALEEAGNETYERVWRFPLFKEYAEQLKSDVADIKNIGGWDGKAGSITAAKFLEAFVPKGVKWAHLDIASMMEAPWLPYASKRGTGVGVRLLTSAVEKLA